MLSTEIKLPGRVTSLSDAANAVVFWAGALIIGCAMFVVFEILTPEARKALVDATTINFEGFVVIAVGASVIIAPILFGLLRIHVTVYDRLLVNWKKRHKNDLILPLVLAPFRPELSSVHEDLIKREANTLMGALFLPFVLPSEPIVDQTLVRKFNTALTVYHITQVNEMVLLVVVIVALWSGATASPEWASHLLHVTTGLLAVALANHIGANKCRKYLRIYTLAEIKHILTFHSDKLRAVAVDVFHKLGAELGGHHAPELLKIAPAGRVTSVNGTLMRAFLASPMAGLSAAEYKEDRDAMLRVKGVLGRCGYDVFYAGENLPLVDAKAKWEDEAFALEIDLEAIRNADLFVLHHPKKTATSAIFELGYALACGKDIAMFIKNRKDLPFLLRGMSGLNLAREFVYRDVDELCSMIETRKGQLLTGV